MRYITIDNHHANYTSRIWDTATGQCLRTLVHEDNAPVTSVRFSPNGKFVVAWTLDSCIRLWNYVEGRCVKTYQGHKNEKYSIGGTFGTYADGEKAFLASGSENGQIVTWEVASKVILQGIDGHEGTVLGVDTFPAKEMLVSCGVDRTVRVWQASEEIDIKIEDRGPFCLSLRLMMSDVHNLCPSLVKMLVPEGPHSRS